MSSVRARPWTWLGYFFDGKHPSLIPRLCLANENGNAKKNRGPASRFASREGRRRGGPELAI